MYSHFVFGPASADMSDYSAARPSAGFRLNDVRLEL